MQRLGWILGPGFTMTGGYAIVSQYGAAGQRMHAGPFYNHSRGYRYRTPASGRTTPLYSPSLNLGWALRYVQYADTTQQQAIETASQIR
jgi:hypothetical protein